MKLALLGPEDIARRVEIERQLFAGDDRWGARVFQVEPAALTPWYLRRPDAAGPTVRKRVTV
ncbi:hypothetical protein LWP59_03430 [Amycolatopsis acidiphila]|uniref:hypothetical protein n=1 Tax=Amycolatopsis acidiphila TaxID=715473 RepID=UPI0019847D5E|nr:hypothetical protein [Amycolatopsis acidiphila]UIJ60748.1 hypothetical protein LWP59_03430 [Amycolatopsis acidiphila]GHG91054.1 hypothetical protein GCM10017788_67020 [Amycolatopsis acidiphila]